jgi:RimJ/RimL family protein N-acetyltransferase
MVSRSPREAPFGGYLAVAEDGLVIGTCAFRPGPSVDGGIEIAHFTLPPYEGRGYATERHAC